MYIVNGQEYEEQAKQKIGGGSEGVVYTFPKNSRACVKLFHPPEDDVGSIKIAAFRAKKITSICESDLALPKQFILPRHIATNRKGDVIGYMMRKLPPNFVKVKNLLEQRFKTDHAIGLKEISQLFIALFGDHALVDGKIEAIGDINVGSIMISPDLAHRAWVDTDSWSHKGFPCLATTEIFCHPDLYPNLNVGSSKVIRHEMHHDRFSLMVMYVLMALSGAHPFRMGIHDRYHSLQERVKNGITIFDSDVIYPSILPSPEVLSDDVLNYVISILKRENKDPINTELLQEFTETIVVCESCGGQYTAMRTHCPLCHEKTTIDLSAITQIMIDDSFFVAGGTIIFAQSVGEELRVIRRQNDQLHIATIMQDGKVHTIQTNIKAKKGMRYRFFDACLVVCQEPYAASPVELDIYRISGGTLTFISKSSTATLENDSAVFSTTAKYLYRIAGNSIVQNKLFGEVLTNNSITKVFRGQTWFTADRMSGADREVLFGYNRSRRDYQWFVCAQQENDDSKLSFSNINVSAMRRGEKLEDFKVYFHTEKILLVRKTIYRGRESVRYTIITLNGDVIDDMLINADESAFKYWEGLTGKLYQGSSVLHISTEGLVKQDLKNGAYTPIKGTEKMIGPNDGLLKFGRKICVPRRDGIIAITKK